MTRLDTDTFDVVAGASVDLNDVAYLDESWDCELGPGRNLGRLGNTGRGITLRSRLGLQNFHLDMRWRSQCDWIAVEQQHAAWKVFGEVLPVFIDLIGRQLILFKRFAVHENVCLGLLVKERRGYVLDVGDFKFVATLERSVENAGTNHILHLASVKSIAFSRLEEIDVNQQVRLAIDLNFETLL